MEHPRQRFWISNMAAIVAAVVLALLIRTFWLQPFYISSGSMIPTLLIGDNIFVSKGAYGYTRYSFPFGDRVDGLKGIWGAKEPALGDVVVFRVSPKDDSNYVKRVVGRAGDRVQMRDGILHINGIDCRLQRIEDITTIDDAGQEITAAQFVETFPNGLSHKILKRAPFGAGPYDNTRAFEVPEGHVFVVGDNRDGSQDSRAMETIGYVALDHLIGQAGSIFFSTGSHSRLHEFWKWWDEVLLSRMFQEVE